MALADLFYFLYFCEDRMRYIFIYLERSFFYIFLMLMVAILGAYPSRSNAEPLPSSSTADWSFLLDSPWTCNAPTGPRWDQWKKSVLLFAASNGYSFKGDCDKILEAVAYREIVRYGAVTVVFRDKNNVVQYVAWYDSKFDRAANPTFGGIVPIFAETSYDVRYDPYQNYPIYTRAQKDDFTAFWTELSISDQWLWQIVASQMRNYSTRVQGCVVPYTKCSNNPAEFAISGGNAKVSIGFSDPSGSDYSGVVWEHHYHDPGILGKFMNVAVIVGLTVTGGAIGEYVGLIAGTAENAAFAAGFGAFTSGLIYGQDIGQSLLDGLKGAGIAYTGKLILNAYGEPDSLVGVAGAGCPTGDQCWFLQMANGFPPVKNLAELHDPFINWSVKAFGTIGENGWYKAVTIPPFLVPGCAASSGCVAAGITIVREDELR
jgi:hypothetical protein